MQYFKGDAEEIKFDESAKVIISDLSTSKDLFWAGAFEAAPLGDLLFLTKKSPLAGAISQDIFRLAFKEIFNAFIHVGTFEAYLTVFNKIFGSSVIVTFTVPAPGRLQIHIEAEGVELSNFVARYIDNNNYIFDDVITFGLDNIVFQTIKGFTTQYELEQMLFEMVPAGIFTEITLTL